MPVVTHDRVTLGDAWTLNDQVEELRGKFHLKKKDLDAYREGSRSEIKKNERAIRKLRQETRLKHLLVTENELGDEHVIKTVFKDERKELLALQRCTATEAIDEMGQTVCQAAQFLNALRHEHTKREAKLVEAEEELARMKQQAQASLKKCEKKGTITKLENSLDKAQVKYETASSITRCYHNILDKLREESLTLPAKLDAMETTLLHQQKELRELKDMAKDAHRSRDESKQQLAKIESEAYESKRQRDSELAAARKEVEGRNSERDKTDKRTARAALLVDTADHKAQELAQEQEKKRAILSNEEVFHRIREAANVTSIPEAMERVMSNRKTNEQLKLQIRSLESLSLKLKTELSLLITQHHNMKYTGEEKLSRGQKCLEEIQKQIYDDEQRSERSVALLESKGDVLVCIKKGVETLLDKLSPVKLKPPQHNFTDGDVFAQLDLCQKKLGQLQMEMTKVGAIDPRTGETYTDQDFHEFLESRIPADNVRIRLQRSNAILAFNHIDSQETQEVLTRQEIKQMGQKIIDAREKKPKKRKKAAK